jgi:hypothetical protein
VNSVTTTHAESDRFALLPLGAAAFVAAAIVGWLLLHDRGTSKPVTIAKGPVLASAAQLATEAKSLGRPIYWAGPRSKWSYELTVTDSGRVFVRYLPRGAAAGDSRSGFLTVGTYPAADAYPNLKKVSTGYGVHSNLLPNDGLLVAPTRLPKNVYLAYRNDGYQVEVYDASTGAARRMALNGLIAQIR